MAAFSNRRRRRKLQAEINVVPYIDVMLVLLVIFMITSSVMNLGVEVNLPQSDGRSVAQTQDPVIVSIDEAGGYLLKVGDGVHEPMPLEELIARVRAIVSVNPDAPVFVAADRDLRYQAVMDTMSALQGAGVSKAALITDPRQEAR